MENKKYTVLIIDDHPLIVSAYKRAFNYVEKQNAALAFDIDEAHDCDNAYEKIRCFSENQKNLDIVFLDISLPPSKDRLLLSGEDLGIKINELLPNTKIIISTAFNDNYRVYSLLKNINPDGFLIKNDLDSENLITAINTVITDPPYYANNILKLLRNEISSKCILDEIDRKLLYELSIGTMMKELPEILKLSLPALEKRKRLLKEFFDTKSPYNKELLQKAKEKGFI